MKKLVSFVIETPECVAESVGFQPKSENDLDPGEKKDLVFSIIAAVCLSRQVNKEKLFQSIYSK